MKLDRTLLNKEKPLTDEELKAFAHKNGFTTFAPRYDSDKASNTENMFFVRVKKLFAKSFAERLGGKKCLRNYSNDFPVKCLEKADENIVASTVMEIASDENLTSEIINSVIDSMQEPIENAAKVYAESVGKSVDDMTDTDAQIVFDQFVDNLLGFMMGKLQTAQSVPEIMDTSKKMGTFEDFNNSIKDNHDFIDFDRKWSHLRSSVGRMLSFDALCEDEENEPTDKDVISTVTEAEVNLVLEDFLSKLNGTEREIVRLQMQ